MILILLGSVLFAVLCMILLGADLFTGSGRRVLLRLAGASGMLASLLWIGRTLSERR